MKLVKPSHEVLTSIGFNGVLDNGMGILTRIEAAGRTCYKTEDRITHSSAKNFIKRIMDRGHESVIEHENISVRIICDRGVTHEIVRHRLASYSQESTRYCNYKGGVTFVIPPWLNIEAGEYERAPECWKAPFNGHQTWFCSMLDHEDQYIRLLDCDWSPQQARSVLPNSLKTEIVMTCNIREWRHILKLRTSEAPHPQMREVMIPILQEFQKKIPVLFDDIQEAI